MGLGGRDGGQCVGRGRSPEMTSSVSHSASAPAGESLGGVHGAAYCSRRGTNHEMASIHCQGAAHPPWAQEEWAQKKVH